MHSYGNNEYESLIDVFDKYKLNLSCICQSGGDGILITKTPQYMIIPNRVDLKRIEDNAIKRYKYVDSYISIDLGYSPEGHSELFWAFVANKCNTVQKYISSKDYLNLVAVVDVDELEEVFDIIYEGIEQCDKYAVYHKVVSILDRDIQLAVERMSELLKLSLEGGTVLSYARVVQDDLIEVFSSKYKDGNELGLIWNDNLRDVLYQNVKETKSFILHKATVDRKCYEKGYIDDYLITKSETKIICLGIDLFESMQATDSLGVYKSIVDFISRGTLLDVDTAKELKNGVFLALVMSDFYHLEKDDRCSLALAMLYRSKKYVDLISDYDNKVIESNLGLGVSDDIILVAASLLDSLGWDMILNIGSENNKLHRIIKDCVELVSSNKHLHYDNNKSRLLPFWLLVYQLKNNI